MFCIHSGISRIKRLIALIGLCAYLFLGLTSPEAASAFLLQINGAHEVSVVSDFSGQEAVVFHHHHLKTGQNDAIFHQNHHQIEPDHVYLLPKKAEQTGLLTENGLQLQLQALFTRLVEFVPFAIPVSWGGLNLPKPLAQPSPDISSVVELRRLTVLLL